MNRIRRVIREEIDDMFTFHAIDADELMQHIKDMDLKSIAPFKRVDGDLDLMGTNIRSMGSIEEIIGYLDDWETIFIEYVREVTPKEYSQATLEDVSYYTTTNIKEDVDPFTDDYIVDIDGLDVGMVVIPTCLKQRPFLVDDIWGTGDINKNGEYMVVRHVSLTAVDTDQVVVGAGAVLRSDSKSGSSCLFKVVGYDKALDI